MNKVTNLKFDLLAVFSLLLVQYLLIIIFVRYQDMWDHACFARDMLTGKRPTSGNFIFYWLVNVFSFFSVEKIPSKISLCFLLACATTYKYYLSKKRVTEILRSNGEFSYYWVTVFIGISLIFVFGFPIPSYFVNGYFLLGNFSPNLWHNSTLIFLFPFSIILFELSFKQLIQFDKKRNVWIAFVIFLNVFIKPSYFFVFAAIYPILLLYKYKLSKNFWYCIIPVLIGVIFLIIEFWSIYYFRDPYSTEKSAVIFQPFYSSPLFSDIWTIPISILFSLFYPILYIAFNFKRVAGNLLFWYVFSSFVLSVLIYLFVAESGPRAAHGNFWWQVIICSWLCYYVTIVSLLKDFVYQGRTLKNICLLCIYILHMFMGIIYFFRLFIVDYF